MVYPVIEPEPDTIGNESEGVVTCAVDDCKNPGVGFCDLCDWSFCEKHLYIGEANNGGVNGFIERAFVMGIRERCINCRRDNHA